MLEMLLTGMLSKSITLQVTSFSWKKGGKILFYLWADIVAHGQKTLLNEYLKMRYSVTLFATAIITANFSDTTQMKMAL